MEKNEDSFLWDGEEGNTNWKSWTIEERKMKQMEFKIRNEFENVKLKINYIIMLVFAIPFSLYATSLLGFFPIDMSDTDISKIQNLNEMRIEACKKEDKKECELIDELLTKKINSLPL